MIRSFKIAPRWLALVAVVLLPAHIAAAAPKATKKPKKPAAGAAAKPGKKGSPASEATKHLAAGTKAYKARKYEVAARELEMANKAAPAPQTLRMLADSQYRIKDYISANASYEKLVADYGDRLTNSERADAEQAMTAIAALTSVLDITVDQEGAAIFVDGNQVGKSPLKAGVRVAPGAHKVRVTANAFDPVEQDVNAPAGDKVPVSLKFSADRGNVGTAIAGAGKLKVTTTPTEATIELDGKELGTGTYDGAAPTGEHRLVVRANGFQVFTEDVTIAAGQTLSKDVQLTAEGATPGDVAEGSKPSSGSQYSGMYYGFGLYGALPISGHVRQPCPTDANCTSSTQFGGGATLHVGYNFGVIGLELTGAFLGERHNEKKNIPGTNDVDDPDYAKGIIARLENYSMYSLGGFVGVGPRVTSHGDTFRFTFGASPGAMIRKFTLKRETGGALLDSYRTGTSTTGFGLVTDASVLIGSTPGFKFTVGIVGLIDFTREVKTPSGDPREVTFQFDGRDITAPIKTPAYIMAQGLQFYVGPQLGIQFGH